MTTDTADIVRPDPPPYTDEQLAMIVGGRYTMREKRLALELLRLRARARTWTKNPDPQLPVPAAGALHASAPLGIKCADCTMDAEALPDLLSHVVADEASAYAAIAVGDEGIA